MSSLVQTVAPDSEPVTRNEAKAHCRIDLNDDDALVDGLIKAAREWCENRIGQQFMPATWRLKLDRFPSWTIELPRPPLTAVSSVVYLDTAGASQTLSSSLYRVDTDSMPGRLTPAYSQLWPVTYSVTSAVTITYTAGYASASAVPQSIKQAILLLVGHWYENREATSDANLREIPQAVESLLMSQWHGSYSLAGVGE
jgi:uncharacterized phiE125 gp8 family phage protein